MRIGIMTFWWSTDNYGQLLQCYALQKYLRNAGHNAFLIRYDPRNDSENPLWRKLLKALNPVLLMRYIRKSISLKKIGRENALHDRHFADFREKYIVQSEKVYSSYSELKDNPPEADCYIVGSDQVWNFNEANLRKCQNLVHAYFLDFGNDNVKRMSYAASWGRLSISQEFRDEIKPLLARFDYVSVREKSGVELCSQCGCGNAKFRCDPTLLLSEDDYRSLYRAECDACKHESDAHKPENGVRKPERKYLLLYMLNNKCDFDAESAYRFAAERNLGVVYVTGNGVVDSREKTFATVPCWLRLIDNAEYVVTNSFHCCVFSLIFQKKFAAVPLIKSFKEMNSRIETLSELFEIKPRWFIGDFAVLEKPADFAPLESTGFDLADVLAKTSLM